MQVIVDVHCFPGSGQDKRILLATFAGNINCPNVFHQGTTSSTAMAQMSWYER